ncbi:MAG: sigma-54-dependent Fis family transcriptional regulator [Deltaproteobacteria bacterium]|nr:sigma-54-dependent Fis family transcriptional regulator [Deltaproteobacteria bacterium]
MENNFAGIVGKCARMRELFRLIAKVADTDTTVLVQGESGTGKELVSRAIHAGGPRGGHLFVPVNCGAIPSELLESELFGHEKGAFTHAIRTRIGRFEMAHGGTVFLDEIAEMSPMLQVKLLRVLQEHEFERVGGTQTIKPDFRVIAATNQNLEEAVKTGKFREDLFYRLNVIPVTAPPLREKPADIPLLVEHFIGLFNETKRRAISGISAGAMEYLIRYDWPGNVRELENIIERMVILAEDDEISVADLPDKITATRGGGRSAAGEIPAQGFVLQRAVADFEREIIIQALNQTGWIKNQAAKLLNVNRTTLIEKMRRYELVKPDVKM